MSGSSLVSSKPGLFLSVNWEDFVAFCHIQLQVIRNSLESLIFCETKFQFLCWGTMSSPQLRPDLAVEEAPGWARSVICFILDSVQPVLIFPALFAFALSAHYAVCFETGKRRGTGRSRYTFISRVLYFLSVNSLCVAGIQMHFNVRWRNHWKLMDLRHWQPLGVCFAFSSWHRWTPPQSLFQFHNPRRKADSPGSQWQAGSRAPPLKLLPPRDQNVLVCSQPLALVKCVRVSLF